MKRITIWDMDFYYKKSFLPNPAAMKLSSFHKQNGDLINFVTEDFHIKMSFDEYYIIKEKSTTPKPPGDLIDDKRVKLIGRPLRFFNNYWEPDWVISAVRPDYTLYPESENESYYNAHVAQFYHNGVRLKIKQPFENSIAYHKKTLVVDKEFWDVSVENITLCLQELKEYKNIAFLHPINLKKIIENDSIRTLFVELRFSSGTIFKFRNNYGQTIDDAQTLFEFVEELNTAHPHVRFTNIPFKTVTKDHWESWDEAFGDFVRCMQIVDLAKKKKVHIRMVSPPNRLDTPYWYYFETFEYWTTLLETLSYVEVMLFSATKKTSYQWFQILNDPMRWSTPNTYFLLKLFTRTDLVEKYGFRQWGEQFLDYKMIKYSSIDQFRGQNKNTEDLMHD